jgi:hypothetical protein
LAIEVNKKDRDFEEPMNQRSSFKEKFDSTPVSKIEQNNSEDSESISCKRSNNTSMMYSNDLYLSQKFIQRQKDN